MNATSREVKISSIEGNRQLLDGGSMFGNVPKEVWKRWIKPDERDRIDLACRALLVETDGQRLLFETGIGAYMDPKLAHRFGVQTDRHDLLYHLSTLDLTHEDIDVVILSHLHFDHAGGLLGRFADGAELLFPNAKFIVGQIAFERATMPHSRDRASFIPGLSQKLENSGRLRLMKNGETVNFSGGHIEMIFSDGHTPGQMHSLVRTPKTSIFFAGDLVPGRAWIHAPVTMGYDRFAEKVIDEKLEVYQRAVPENWFFFFTHDPEMSLVQIEKDESGRFHPTNETASFLRRLV